MQPPPWELKELGFLYYDTFRFVLSAFICSQFLIYLKKYKYLLMFADDFVSR